MLLSDFPSFTMNGQVALYAAIALPILGAGYLLMRRRGWGELTTGSTELNFEAADAWLPPEREIDERRSSIRRGGTLVEVKVVDPKKPKRVMDGFVVNRSTHGVRLALKNNYFAGVNLFIRAANAPDEVAWTGVTVRNSEEVGDYFKLGCQFDESVPWNILLMFG